MMKTSLALLSALLLTATTFAANLTVNATPTTETLTDVATLYITDASIGTGQIGIFTTQMTFTLPSITPTYEEVIKEGGKLIIVPSATGELLIADSTTKKLKSTNLSLGTSQTIQILALVKKVGDNQLGFDVYMSEDFGENGIEGLTSTSVTAPSEGLSFSSLNFEGEGSATEIALSIAPTTIVPHGDTTNQDPSDVLSYVDWVNNAGKDYATSTASDADKADAFAMNVGGKPKLEITAIDVANKTITVKGSYDETGDANLGDIHGTLYITYAETLSGEAKTIAVDFTIDGDENEIDANGIATVEIPDGAKFVKATVSLTEPEAKL